jgi:hypothetical protein
MALLAGCNQCGKKYRFKEEKAGRSVPCKACGGEIIVPSLAMGAFQAERRLVRPEPTQTKVTTTDREEAVRIGRQGLDLLILAFAFAVVSAIIRLALSRGAFEKEGFGDSAAAWLPLVTSALGLLAPLRWRAAAQQLERKQVIDAALGLQLAILVVLVVERFGLSFALLDDLAGLAGWSYYVLVVAVLHQLAYLVDRTDVRESADFVMQLGVGAIVFSLIGVALLTLPVAPILALATMFYIGAILCMVFWIWNYAALLLRLREAM